MVTAEAKHCNHSNSNQLANHTANRGRVCDGMHVARRMKTKAKRQWVRQSECSNHSHSVLWETQLGLGNKTMFPLCTLCTVEQRLTECDAMDNHYHMGSTTLMKYKCMD